MKRLFLTLLLVMLSPTQQLQSGPPGATALLTLGGLLYAGTELALRTTGALDLLSRDATVFGTFVKGINYQDKINAFLKTSGSINPLQLFIFNKNDIPLYQLRHAGAQFLGATLPFLGPLFFATCAISAFRSYHNIKPEDAPPLLDFTENVLTTSALILTAATGAYFLCAHAMDTIPRS